MPGSYSALYYHIVFGTKYRVPYLIPEIEQQVWRYIRGIARRHRMVVIQVGGIEDHVHVLIRAPTTLAPCKIAQYLKGASSRWIHQEFPNLSEFAWQDGYGVFSISKSVVPTVIRYIENQRQHHRTKDFRTEYLELLNRHEVDYDPRYLWD